MTTVADMLAAVAQSTVSVSEQRIALNEIFAQVPGIVMVYPHIPAAIQSAHLPALLLEPLNAEHSQEYAGHLATRRLWAAHLYVALWSDKREFELEQAGEPFLDSLPITLTACPVVRLADTRAFHVEPVTTSSVQRMVYNDQTYAGVICRFATRVEALIMRITA